MQQHGDVYIVELEASAVGFNAAAQGTALCEERFYGEPPTIVLVQCHQCPYAADIARLVKAF